MYGSASIFDVSKQSLLAATTCLVQFFTKGGGKISTTTDRNEKKFGSTKHYFDFFDRVQCTFLLSFQFYILLKDYHKRLHKTFWITFKTAHSPLCTEVRYLVRSLRKCVPYLLLYLLMYHRATNLWQNPMVMWVQKSHNLLHNVIKVTKSIRPGLLFSGETHITKRKIHYQSKHDHGWQRMIDLATNLRILHYCSMFSISQFFQTSMLGMTIREREGPFPFFFTCLVFACNVWGKSRRVCVISFPHGEKLYLYLVCNSLGDTSVTRLLSYTFSKNPLQPRGSTWQIIFLFLPIISVDESLSYTVQNFKEQ